MTTLQAERVFIGDPDDSFASDLLRAFESINPSEQIIFPVNPALNFEPLVRAGTHILNLIAPDWRTKINLDKLDVASEHECVLGQVFGSYQKGCEVLASHGVPYFPAEYGFALAGVGTKAQVMVAYGRLTDTWKEAMRNDDSEGASAA